MSKNFFEIKLKILRHSHCIEKCYFNDRCVWFKFSYGRQGRNISNGINFETTLKVRVQVPTFNLMAKSYFLFWCCNTDLQFKWKTLIIPVILNCFALLIIIDYVPHKNSCVLVMMNWILWMYLFKSYDQLIKLKVKP